MKLYKALRAKNTLVGELKEVTYKIQKNNVKLLINDFDYDIIKLLIDRTNIKNKLIDLKLRINNATKPMYSIIYTLGELKSELVMLRSINTEAGSVQERFSETIMEKERILSPVDIEVMTKKIELQISQYQDQLEEFNYITDI